VADATQVAAPRQVVVLTRAPCCSFTVPYQTRSPRRSRRAGTRPPVTRSTTTLGRDELRTRAATRSTHCRTGAVAADVVAAGRAGHIRTPTVRGFEPEVTPGRAAPARAIGAAAKGLVVRVAVASARRVAYGRRGVQIEATRREDGARVHSVEREIRDGEERGREGRGDEASARESTREAFGDELDRFAHGVTSCGASCGTARGGVSFSPRSTSCSRCEKRLTMPFARTTPVSSR